MHAPRDLHHDVPAFREGEEPGQVGERLGRDRRLERLPEAEMVDDQHRVGMGAGEPAGRVQESPAEQVDRERVAGRRAEDASDPRVVRIDRCRVGHH